VSADFEGVPDDLVGLLAGKVRWAVLGWAVLGCVLLGWV